MSSPGDAVFLGGAVIAGGAGVVFMAVLLASGGLWKSRQFQVIGELLKGQHGVARKRLTLGSFAGLALGAMVLFVGVGLQDAERARRCRVFCTGKGYARGVIGPSVRVNPTRRNAAAFVACTCQGGADAPLEVEADSL